MTRTALKRNGFSRIPLRSIRQGAKALFKPEEQNRVTRESYKYIEKIRDNIHLINFNRTGWRLVVSKILNTTPQHAGGFIQKNFPEMWEKAWKHSR